MIGNGVGGDPQEPRGEWDSAPFKATEIRERLMEYVGSQVFRLIAAANSARDVSVHALEVLLIELSETAGIFLRRFDEPPLVGFHLCGLQRALRGTSSQ